MKEERWKQGMGGGERRERSEKVRKGEEVLEGKIK